jgi:CheY-like chemotaxis protein
MNIFNPKLISTPIIIVDDDSDDQFLIEDILKRLGVSSPIYFFDNGKQALEYLNATKEGTFMILSDINMPEMNGLELRRRINMNDELRRRSIPFVFFSTAARDVEVTAAFDMTVQGFFVKNDNYESMKDSLEVIFAYWTRCKHPNSIGRG